MKKWTLLEWLVIIAILAIVFSAIVGALKGNIHVGPDGNMIYTIELDGHQYYKTDKNLTHSAACPACAQKERP